MATSTENDDAIPPTAPPHDIRSEQMPASRADAGRDSLDAERQRIRAQYGRAEPSLVAEILDQVPLDEAARVAVSREAADIVTTLRQANAPTMMESFLGEYGLSTREGVGLMCLAEALLRVPDAETIDELIADKLEGSDWAAHLGQSSSPLVNASTWALMLTGRLLDDGEDPLKSLRSVLRRAGEPVVRTAVAQAMKLLGKQFVLGRTIEEAVDEARGLEKRGYTYSYDMLGEAARTDADAKRYHAAYDHAIKRLSRVAGEDVRSRPGISVKLSALHPRYEWTHRDTVMSELLPRARSLAIAAADAGIGFNIDAEEADRLDLSLDVIEALLQTPELEGWDGFGVVVQAYGRRAVPVIDWLVALARRENRKLMVRLVKGAYWDTEVKEAQALGLASFPVFTRKANTDLSYLVCAHRLLSNRDVIYPQFATHNAHTVVAIRHMAEARDQRLDDASDVRTSYEFQRLHGMGESLHETVRQQHGTRCRVYAPVGAHRDLLAYLVRRLLENGANSSFVNQIVDESVPAALVASDPVAAVIAEPTAVHPGIRHPSELYGSARTNSRGFRINDPASIQPLLDARQTHAEATWDVAPMLAGEADSVDREARTRTCASPADPGRGVGQCIDASVDDVATAIAAARDAFAAWQSLSPAERGNALRRAADLYEDNVAEFTALLCREAGKTLLDGISEVREAADFLRYYAVEAERPVIAGTSARLLGAHGVIACISPWNFPLAIFTGQIAGALAAGNVVLAKPAEQSPIVAGLAVEMLRTAGIPDAVLQLLPGDGATVGRALTSNPQVDGVCFTGSTAVARLIERALAGRSEADVAAGCSANPMLIAETGGLNAMIVDSTALTEQVVRDVVVSAFQSAGQRCSALRVLYVQKEAETRVLDMLKGAVDALHIGDPWQLATDVGPVIDAEARTGIVDWIQAQQSAGRVVHEGRAPGAGHFVPPVIIKVDGIHSLEREVFGPVLHVATFEADAIDDVVNAINGSGYGLTFGLHTRIDDRVQRIVERIRCGNVYVNRNQIGAVVGSQPFGGEGLSGTGPKAGGPLYLRRFLRLKGNARPTDPGSAAPSPASSSPAAEQVDTSSRGHAVSGAVQWDAPTLAAALAGLPASGSVARGQGLGAGGRIMPGPTGESNHLSVHPRGTALLLGDDAELALQQTADARAAGCSVLVLSESRALVEALADEWQGDPCVRCESVLPEPDALAQVAGISVVAVATTDVQRRLAVRRALAAREGAIIPVVDTSGDVSRFVMERHVCIDTTAAGGNASLLAASV